MHKEFLSQIHTQRTKSVLKIENNRFFIGKEEFLPFSAEMHYFRVNKRYWSFCFERIRKAGFRIVSTAIPWNLHESPPGTFDFSGHSDPRKDLLVFLELAREFGLKVIIRPGPYVDSQWPNGGYPDYLFESADILARDSQGGLVPLPERLTGSHAKQPSLGHPRFKNQIKKYINNLSEVLKNYVFPKGPIFAIQLDHQTNSSCSPFGSDYNPESVRVLYSQFLQKKYAEIKTVKSLYREKWKSFEEATPPQQLLLKKPTDLIKYFDWISFKEEQTARHLQGLKECFQENEISILFFGNFPVHPEVLPNLSQSQLSADQFYRSGEALWKDDFYSLERQLKYWGNSNFPWLSGFYCGNSSSNPSEHRKYFPVTPVATKFMFDLALACGIKAFNFSMFVERDHWYDSPLGTDGGIQANYEIVARLVSLNEKIPLNRLESTARVGLALYRPYWWYRSLDTRFPFDYFKELLRIFEGASQDLSYLKIDYRVLDLEDSNFEQCDLIFIPSAEFMSASAQQKIVNLVKSGKKVILYGLVPHWDLDFKNCQILSKFLKLKSSPERSVAQVEDRDRSFPAYLLGHLRKSGKGSKEILWDQNKCVATRLASGKGVAYFFSFDFTSHKNPVKLLYLEGLLKENKILPVGSTSDLEVNLKLQRFDNSFVMYLFNPSGSFWNPKPESKKDVIVKLDTKRLGLKGGLKLTELVTGEVIKTTANQLAGGVSFAIGEFESRIYLIGK